MAAPSVSKPQESTRFVYSGALVLLMSLSGCVTVEPAAEASAVLNPAHAFLVPDPFPNLVVEIHWAPGNPPSDLALAELQERVTTLVKKEEVTFLEPARLTGWAAERRTWTSQDRFRLSEETSSLGLRFRELGRDGDALLQIFFVAGGDALNNRGVETHGRIYIYEEDPDEVLDTSGFFADEIQRSTLMHELGHAFGLVNCGITMQTPREHPESPCHSTNSKSVMAPAVHFTPLDPERVTSDRWIVHEFDENDLADIQAFREART